MQDAVPQNDGTLYPTKINDHTLWRTVSHKMMVLYAGCCPIYFLEGIPVRRPIQYPQACSKNMLTCNQKLTLDCLQILFIWHVVLNMYLIVPWLQEYPKKSKFSDKFLIQMNLQRYIQHTQLLVADACASQLCCSTHIHNMLSNEYI